MLPAYRRGDVLLIDNRFSDLNIGDIVVYNIPGRDIPIVHRIHVINNPYLLSVRIIYRGSEEESTYLTKGDNNHIHDQQLYEKGWIRRINLISRSVLPSPWLHLRKKPCLCSLFWNVYHLDIGLPLSPLYPFGCDGFVHSYGKGVECVLYCWLNRLFPFVCISKHSNIKQWNLFPARV